MIQNFKIIDSIHASNVIALSHDSQILVVCQTDNAIIYNLNSDFKTVFTTSDKISAAIVLSCHGETPLHYIILATVQGQVFVLSSLGKLVYKQFVHVNITVLKVNYSQDFIYALNGNVIITLKISFTGSLLVCEKINLLGSLNKDVCMLGSEYRGFLSPITININGQSLYNKYDNVIVGVGKKISYYGRMDKRNGSWAMGQLEGSIG